jgi:3-hydroxy-9,10-secoandrosta-1,3,5(10)-triene-9,17-dione monooxygenase
MPRFSTPAQTMTRQAMLEHVRAIAPRFAERAAAAEAARQIPEASVQDMLAAGFARFLVPPRFGGYGLDFETWFDVALEISRFDCSHGWCASLMIHHANLIGCYPEEAQQAVWNDGPDVAVAASFTPSLQVVRAAGGFRISGTNSAFASGVRHSSWVILGGLAPGEPAPELMLFLVPPGEYTVRDTWFMTGMCATGSNTIVTDKVFLPHTRALSLDALRTGKTPGGALNDDPIFRTPFFHYAPLTFAAPMLGAARGAYEQFRDWTKSRKAPDGSAMAEKASVQVRMARTAADLDAAELLLRRTTHMPNAPDAHAPHVLARSVRDFARASELAVAAIDSIIALCGTAAFATSHPIQRAWRDIHLASMHIGLNPEFNYAHFGRIELGLERDPNRPFF